MRSLRERVNRAIYSPSAGISAERVLLDVVESWNGYHNATSGNPNSLTADIATPTDIGAGSVASALMPAVSGAVGPLLFDPNPGRTVHNWTSAAAATGILGQTAAGFYGIPLGRRFQPTVVRFPIQFFPRKLRRYRLDFLCFGFLGPGVADAACGIVSNSGFQAMVTGGAPAEAFMGWVARGALNAGRWTPRFRLALAGAVVDGPDSGVPFIPVPFQYNQLSIVYEEGLTPRVRWLVDGREVFQVAGDAAMITPSGSVVPAKAMGAGAGVTSIQYAETRFRVWEIG